MAFCRRGRSRRKKSPMVEEWVGKEEDPPGFEVKLFEKKGRGVVTTVERGKGEFLLMYLGEVVHAEEGERREEEDGGSGYRFFYKVKGQNLCIDATAETSLLGRLVNHGKRSERNAIMRTVQDSLCLFSLRDIAVGEEILYDYGIKTLPWERESKLHWPKASKLLAWRGVIVLHTPFRVHIMAKKEQDEGAKCAYGSRNPEPCDIVGTVPCDLVAPEPCGMAGTEPRGIVGIKPCDIVGTEPCDIVGTEPCDIVAPEPCDIVAPEPCGMAGTEPCDIVATEPCDIVSTEPSDIVATEPCEEVGTEPCDVVATEPGDIIGREPCDIVGTEPCDIVGTEPFDIVATEPCDIVAIEPPYKAATKPCDIVSTEPSDIVVTEPSDIVGKEPSDIVGKEPCDIVGTEHCGIVCTEPCCIVDTEPVDIVGTEPYDIVATEPCDIVGTEPCDVVATEPCDIICREPCDISGTEPSDIVGTEPFDIVATEPCDIVALEPPDIVAIEPCDIVSTEPSDIVGTEPSDIVGTEPCDIVGIEPCDIVTTEPCGIVGTEPYGIVCTEPGDIVGTEPYDIVATEPCDIVGTEPSDIVGTEPCDIVGSKPCDIVATEPCDIFGTKPCDISGTEPCDIVGTEPCDIVGTEPCDIVGTEPYDIVGTEPCDIVGTDPCDIVGTKPYEVVYPEPYEVVEHQQVEGRGGEQIELVGVRDNNGFGPAECDQHQQGLLNRMPDFIPDSDSGAESDILPYPMLNDIVIAVADSTSSSKSNISGKQKVMTVKSMDDRNRKIDYSKRHSCLFCGKLDLKIARHLCSVHRDERAIAQLPAKGKRGSRTQLEREHMLDSVRNEGDFLYNIELLKNGDKKGKGLIVAKRPMEGIHTTEDYLPCKYCLRFYVKSELWRHGRHCAFMPKPLLDSANLLSRDSELKESKRFIRDGVHLLNGAGVSLKQLSFEEKEEFHLFVRDAIQDDELGKSLKRDTGIILFGKNEFERLGRRRANEVRYRMRVLERIKQLVKSVVPELDTVFELASLLKPELFDAFVKAVRELVGIEDEKSLNGVLMFRKPQLARKTGQILRKFAEMCEGRAVAERKRETRQDISDFMFLYSKDWTNKIGSMAHQSSLEKKFNKKEVLPVTEDVQKVQKYLDIQISEQSRVLSSKPSKENWRSFGKILLTKLTLFNFRRGNECAAMQIHKFQTRADWKSSNHEIYNSLSNFEKELAKRMDLVEVMGKQNRKVPVLLTPATKAGVTQLINMRTSCGVDMSNPYVFAKGNKTFIQGNEALRYVLDRIPDLQHAEHLKFTTMRKYLATVVQVFGMNEKDVMEIARHMGHELSVHRKFYRLQDDVIELAKISKLLLAVESGNACQFSGLSLDDLDLNDLPDGEMEVPVEATNDVPVSGIEDLPDGEEMEVPVDATNDVPVSKNEGLRKRKLYTFNDDTDNIDLDDEVKDPSYNTKEAAGSDSDSSCGEIKAIKRRKISTSKKVWTEMEKLALQPLVSAATRHKKPPKKEEVVALQKRVANLKHLQWTKIKHQVWAIAQSKIKRKTIN